MPNLDPAHLAAARTNTQTNLLALRNVVATIGTSSTKEQLISTLDQIIHGLDAQIEKLDTESVTTGLENAGPSQVGCERLLKKALGVLDDNYKALLAKIKATTNAQQLQIEKQQLHTLDLQMAKAEGDYVTCCSRPLVLHPPM